MMYSVRALLGDCVGASLTMDFLAMKKMAVVGFCQAAAEYDTHGFHKTGIKNSATGKNYFLTFFKLRQIFVPNLSIIMCTLR